MKMALHLVMWSVVSIIIVIAIGYYCQFTVPVDVYDHFRRVDRKL